MNDRISGGGARRPHNRGFASRLPAHRAMAALLLLLLPAFTLSAAHRTLSGDTVSTTAGDLIVRPVHHATFLLGWMGLTIYVDPVGGAERFADLPAPDLVLLTDLHGDHLNVDTLKAIAGENTAIVGPSATLRRLPETLRLWSKPLDNGETKTLIGLKIEAIPAYNLTEERQKYHPKGRGNGYLLTLTDTGPRVYISGDTEGIPEMRALTNIDVAFVCMNLPYTMSVEQAAEAVRAFKPKIVYPYHSRGSDLNRFQTLLGADAGVEVRLRDWYPE